ncbi:Mannitol repressor [Mucilaginibacter lappiensis]|uniref:Mannitol repressor n=1 Tax=Mucilaginibacter lappiensis TaxID=354630 RepID=A0ABR6PKJ2_9SPHI|nr:MltR family transcriptional regulator [Mucilaginibacter lappiensis]MBB6110291.1 hypothetical protein [Mucilaginibacter lappiensis]SIR29364.1 Mannitol repressor [Mucilaginibacter lappiensis]
MHTKISDLDKFIEGLPPGQKEAAREVVEFVSQLEQAIEKFDPEVLKDHRKLYELRDQLIEESDRGLCLFAVGRLEVILQDLLDKKLVGSKTFKKQLFGNNGALATLSSKIKMCYSLGLISKGYFNEIDNLRDVRNTFAHSDQPLNFESLAIDALCKKFQLFTAEPERANRARFISTFLYLTAGLMAEIRQCRPIAEKEELLTPKNIAHIGLVGKHFKNTLMGKETSVTGDLSSENQ